MTITIRLLGEPVPKGRPRFTRSGHAYTPPSTRAYEEALAYQAAVVMGNRAPLTGPLEVSVLAFMAVPRSWPEQKQAEALNQIVLPTKRPDADNFFKIVDSLNGVVWRDDAQICKAHVLKRYSDKPRLQIEVREMIGEGVA